MTPPSLYNKIHLQRVPQEVNYLAIPLLKFYHGKAISVFHAFFHAWYIDNSDVEYFFDGVIQLTKGNTNYEINVYMLPPEDNEFFELEMEGDPGDYEISIKANLYYWSDKAPEPDTPSAIHNIVGDDTRYLVEVVADSLTKDIMKDYADYIYALDTIYNRKGTTTYHFILSSDFDGVDYSKSKYMMLVNAADHRVDVYDTKGNTFLSEEY